MFGRTTYLIYVLAFCLVPTLIFWLIGFRFIHKNLKVLGMTALVVFVYLCVTDPLAETWHNWFFTQDRLLGAYMLNFPVEEGLFFLLVPIAVATATLCFLSLRESATSR